MKRAMLFGVIVIIMVLGMGISVRANFEKGFKMNSKERQLLENEYLGEVRQILLEKGCKNAGVTLTYVTDAEGNRSYVVSVHHIKIKRMNAQEVTLLQARIREAADKMMLGEVVLKQI